MHNSVFDSFLNKEIRFKEENLELLGIYHSIFSERTADRFFFRKYLDFRKPATILFLRHLVFFPNVFLYSDVDSLKEKDVPSTILQVSDFIFKDERVPRFQRILETVELHMKRQNVHNLYMVHLGPIGAGDSSTVYDAERMYLNAMEPSWKGLIPNKIRLRHIYW